MSLKNVLFLIAILLLTACSPSRTELHFSDAKVGDLKDYHGKWVLINYWAVWCKPCIKEIPELNHVNARDNVQVLGYNFDKNTGSSLQEQTDKLNIQFPNLSRDPIYLIDSEAPRALPATMLFSPDGKFVTWLMGPQDSESLSKVMSGV